jgi:hypothetical protein
VGFPNRVLNAIEVAFLFVNIINKDNIGKYPAVSNSENKCKLSISDVHSNRVKYCRFNIAKCNHGAYEFLYY